MSIQVQDRGVITIPSQLRKLWNLTKGDFLNVTITKDEEVIMNPISVIDKSILKASQNALKELREGETPGPFANMSEFKEYLDQR